MKISTFIKKYESIFILFILIIGLIFRFLLINNVEEPIDRDAKLYYEIAQDILEGNGLKMALVNDRVSVPPGYPIFIASVLKYTNKVSAVYYVQAILNIFSIFLVWFCLKNINTNELIRLVSILLFTIDTSFIYVNILYATTLSIFFISLFLFVSTSRIPFLDKQILKPVIEGIIITILIYIRPTFYLLPVFILFAILFSIVTKKFSLSKTQIIIFSTIVLLYSPWMMKSNQMSKVQALNKRDFDFLWKQHAEIPYKTIWYNIIDINQYENYRTTRDSIYKGLISKYKTEYNLSSEEEIKTFLKQKGIQNIIQNPIRYLILCSNRFLIFWFSPPIGASTLTNFSPLIFWFVLISKYILTIVSILGLFLMLRNESEKYFNILIIVLYLTLLHSSLHAIQRYFLPILPLTYYSLGYFFQNIYNKHQILNMK